MAPLLSRGSLWAADARIRNERRPHPVVERRMMLGLALGGLGSVLGRYVTARRQLVRVRPVPARAARTSLGARRSRGAPHTEGLRSAGASGRPSWPAGDK